MAGTRKRNPEIMKQISSFVEEYFFEYHGSPSMQKIATAIGTSKSTAYYYVNEMAEKGMLAILQNVVAANYGISKTDLERLRGICVNEVKKINGSITFDEAIGWQS